MTDSDNQESSRDIDYTHCIWTQHQLGIDSGFLPIITLATELAN